MPAKRQHKFERGHNGIGVKMPRLNQSECGVKSEPHNDWPSAEEWDTAAPFRQVLRDSEWPAYVLIPIPANHGRFKDTHLPRMWAIEKWLDWLDSNGEVA